MFAAVLIAVVVVAVVGLAARYNSERLRVLRELSGARPTPIKRVAEGTRAKVVGTLEYVGEPLTSPFTGRRCAFYHITVEEKRNDRWYEIIREEKRMHFGLRDAADDVAIVQTGAAKIVADVCIETKSGTLDDPSPSEEQYLATHGQRSEGWFFNKTLRYREGILEEGEIISVFGSGVREPDPDGVAHPRGYRDPPRMRLVMSGSLDDPLLISDVTHTLD